MKLREYEGKKIFVEYGIAVPKSVLVETAEARAEIAMPVVLKAQVLSGDRRKNGGIIFAANESEIKIGLANLFGKTIEGEEVEKVLIEERLDIAAEYYASITYDTDTRGPVLSVSATGGSGIAKAKIYPLDITENILPESRLREILIDVKFQIAEAGELIKIIQALWKIFLDKYALLVEINPIIKTKSTNNGSDTNTRIKKPEEAYKFIAGDAKVILDDEKINPDERRFVSMGGDIAVLASGGGASMLNIDSLLEYGGRPANYTEYSGNPKADVVKELTRRVLEQEGINGLWVIGGTANFTDMYETMSGFIEGLESLDKKPAYPILIRRDGPRGKDAHEMLERFAKEKGYNMRIYGSELPMDESAKKIVELAKQYKSSKA